MKDPSNQKSSVFKFALETQMLRSMIREYKLFVNSQEPVLLCSLKGDILHPSLVDFYSVAEENYKKCLVDPHSELNPVFVTIEDELESNDVNKWPIKKIKQKIESLLVSCSDPDLSDQYRFLFNKLNKSSRKPEFVNLFSDLQDEIKQIALRVLDEQDDE